MGFTSPIKKPGGPTRKTGGPTRSSSQTLTRSDYCFGASAGAVAGAAPAAGAAASAAGAAGAAASAAGAAAAGAAAGAAVSAGAGAASSFLPPQAASASARAATPKAIFTFIGRYPKFRCGEKSRPGQLPFYRPAPVHESRLYRLSQNVRAKMLSHGVRGG
jgi:hypothetical protein